MTMIPIAPGISNDRTWAVIAKDDESVPKNIEVLVFVLKIIWITDDGNENLPVWCPKA